MAALLPMLALSLICSRTLRTTDRAG